MTQSRATAGSTDANNCELCAKHTYRPTMGATTPCLACPRGTEAPNEGNIECTACAVGYYNNNLGEACKPAPAGTFINTTGAYVTTPW